jgi:hypothetical protein
MTPTISTRRKLWIAAGGRCSICRKHLITEPSDLGTQTVIGEEAHIIAQRPNGPRGDVPYNHDIDHYDNLIALCLDHHREIDDDPQRWPVDKLREVKADHEKRIRRDFVEAQASPRVIVPESETEKGFSLVLNGRELWDCVAFAHAYKFGQPRDTTETEADYLAGAFDQIKDYGEIASFMESLTEQREAQRALGALMEDMLERGLALTARSLMLRIEGGVLPPGNWRQAEVYCWRYRDLLEILSDGLPVSD